MLAAKAAATITAVPARRVGVGDDRIALSVASLDITLLLVGRR
jgi:hypothetical protein